MRKLVCKLRSRRGESLTETLCAILILALAATMFVVMARSAVNLSRKATEATAALYKELTTAETQSGTGGAGEVEVHIDVAGMDLPIVDVEVTAPVRVFGAEAALQSYALEKKEATP